MSPFASPRTALVTVAFLVASTATLALASVGDYTCVDRTKVYHGNHRLFQRPCEVSSDRIFQLIPAYQEVLRRGLTEKDAQYHLLMRKASARFSEAVKKMVARHGHDLVAEVGAVRAAREGAAPIPDRTDDVIQALD